VTSSNRENDALEKALSILSFLQKTFNDIFDYSILTKIIVKIVSNIVILFLNVNNEINLEL
jgi:hypothetical protein